MGCKLRSTCASPLVTKEACDCGRMANAYKHFLAHCGAEACDCGRRIFIPVWVRQDTTVRMVNNAYRGAGAGPARPARGTTSALIATLDSARFRDYLFNNTVMDVGTGLTPTRR
jgi:hypothetical protein